MDRGVVLYGAGKRCRILIEALGVNSVSIIAIIDSNPQMSGTSMLGYTIEGPESLRKYRDYRICITVGDWNEYRDIEKKIVEEYGFSLDNVILRNELIFEAVSKDPELIDYIKLNGRRTEKECNNPIYFGVIGGLVLGGVEERVKLLCSSMIKNGRENTYIITDNKQYEGVYAEIEDHLIKTDVVEEHLRENITCLVKTIVDLGPCTLVTNQPDELLVASYIVKSIRPDIVRVFSIISGGFEQLYDEYTKMAIRSDLYIGVSEDIKKAFLDRGISNVVSMKVPFPCEEVIERNYSISETLPLRIGYAGRLDGFKGSQKRMDVLLKVIEGIHEEGIPFLLEIAGDGPAETDMKRFVSDRNLDRKVSFLGRIEKSQIQNFWKEQDIGINVADYEGRSISVAEIMGGGAVPVVTDTSGVREDIENGINGYIVPIGDYSSVIERIKYLNAHRETLSDMGRRAHRDIWPKSRMDVHLRFWEKILTEY